MGVVVRGGSAAAAAAAAGRPRLEERRGDERVLPVGVAQ